MSNYKRILLKLSGEAFINHEKNLNLDEKASYHIATSIKEIQDLGVEIAIVLGAGNILRGSLAKNINRVRADHIGMIATVINGLLLQEALEKHGCQVKVFSAFECGCLAENFSYERVKRFLAKNNIVVFVGGSGSCYFTTDTAAAVRALEIEADVLLKATKVDGVYDKDPQKYSDAKRFEKISYTEVLDKQLKVIDGAAVALCRENNLPIYIFDIFKEKNLKKVILKEQVGTLISGE